MKYLIISKAGCLPCAQAKQWLNHRKYQYAEKMLDTGFRASDRDYISKEELFEQYPFVKTLPAIFILEEDGTETYIGGYTDLIKT